MGGVLKGQNIDYVIFELSCTKNSAQILGLQNSHVPLHEGGHKTQKFGQHSIRMTPYKERGFKAIRIQKLGNWDTKVSIK